MKTHQHICDLCDGDIPCELSCVVLSHDPTVYSVKNLDNPICSKCIFIKGCEIKRNKDERYPEWGNSLITIIDFIDDWCLLAIPKGYGVPWHFEMAVYDNRSVVRSKYLNDKIIELQTESWLLDINYIFI